MDKSIIIQGKTISQKEIEQIKEILARHPTWGRTKISRVLSEEWDWRNDKGQIKDIACRSLLRKLENKGHIKLPAPRHKPLPRMRDQRRAQLRFSFLTNISEARTLKEIIPLTISVVSPRSDDGKLFAALLAEHHYLGYKGSVGEHLAYLIRDNCGRSLACLLFGAPAWKVAPRDNYIGWKDEQRQRNLKLVANNMRFLLLSRVPHLASHLLGIIARRVSRDWQEKYGHPIVLLETFVEKQRFTGTCYRAANWVCVGQTRGRSRNDRYNCICVPIKDIYCYPLTRNFKELLTT